MGHYFGVSENVFVLLEVNMFAMVKSWELSHMFSDLGINLAFHKMAYLSCCNSGV